MFNSAKERNKWKVRIAECVNTSDLVSRPVSKCMAEVMAGMLTNSSLQLSKIWTMFERANAITSHHEAPITNARQAFGNSMGG